MIDAKRKDHGTKDLYYGESYPIKYTRAKQTATKKGSKIPKYTNP